MFRNLLKAQENLANDLRVINAEIERREQKEKEDSKEDNKE